MTEQRDDYPHHLSITTRWSDNDAYNHLNNVVYYSFFDTVINDYLVKAGGLDIATSPVVGVTVESHCEYRSPIAFPEAVTAGLWVAHLGNTSVRYEIGIFRGDDANASAEGHFVHVFVDRATMEPMTMPDEIRTALAAIAT